MRIFFLIFFFSFFFENCFENFFLNFCLKIFCVKMYGFGGLGEVEVEIWSDVTIAGRTTTTKRKDRATQPLDHGRLR